LVNADCTLCLEKPKISLYTSQMLEVISGILRVSQTDISIKATTMEKMGFVGREEGLTAYATVLIEKAP